MYSETLAGHFRKSHYVSDGRVDWDSDFKDTIQFADGEGDKRVSCGRAADGTAGQIKARAVKGADNLAFAQTRAGEFLVLVRATIFDRVDFIFVSADENVPGV